MAGTYDEKDCIRACLAGDTDAFAPIVETYQRMIHDLAYRMTGSMTDAEDLAQQIFIRAYNQLGTYRGESKFSSWLYRIGINTCLNWKKSKARREVLHEDWQKQQAESRAESHDLSDRVQQALLQLNPNQRAAIVLTVYEEMSHAEAARMLGCSETTVSWRLFVARKILKRKLGGCNR